MINRVEIKMDAKVLVRTARVSPIVMTAIVMAICFVLDRVVDLVEGGSLFYTYTLNWDYLQASLQGDVYAMDMLLNNLPASTASSFFFSTLVSLFTVVKIFLWSMLFVIPGIIAAYRYRFAYYNLLSDDALSAGDAIRLSCRQTLGYKGELFMLDLSFIGWSLLSSLTMGLLNVWLTPYMTLCDLAYFEDAQRRLGASPYREL